MPMRRELEEANPVSFYKEENMQRRNGANV